MSQLRKYSQARIAITTAFVINGATVGAFYARVPDFKKELNVSNSALGIALLCIAVGVLIGLGFSGKQSAKRGSAPITYYATYALALSLLLVGPVFNYLTLCLTFIVFGACLSTQDVAMNSHAIVLEHEADKRYMSTFHAMFSLGALSGGVVGGLLAQQRFSIMWQCAFIATLIAISNFCVRNMFLPADLDKHTVEGKKKIKRPKTFLIVGLLGIIFIGGALSMLFLLRSILLLHKPSSLTGLVWAGSTAFTMIQTRTLMPGNPRLGVRFDSIVFYPSLAICFISALFMLHLWLKSEDITQEP